MTDDNPHAEFYALRNLLWTDLAAATRLLEKNPSMLELRSGIGETVLHWMAVEDQREIIELLVSRGAKIDTQNDFGDTPLTDAAQLGYIDLCRFLVKHGANFRHVSARDGGSALSKAATSQQFETVEYIVGLLRADEDLNALFSHMDAEMVLDQSSPTSEWLAQRGLRRRWDTESA